jgi:hypothetical protein
VNNQMREAIVTLQAVLSEYLPERIDEQNHEHSRIDQSETGLWISLLRGEQDSVKLPNSGVLYNTD